MNIKNFKSSLKRFKSYGIPLALSAIVIWRFNYNFNEYEKAIKKEQVFDVRKANEQLKIYKQIYDASNDVERNHRLLQAASSSDIEKIKEVFAKYENLGKEELEQEILKLKKEVEFQEDKEIKHQGVKLAKIYYGYEPSEDALKKLRENYIEHRKKVDGEKK